MSATIAGALRRQLLARGLTRKPTCPTCRFERSPKDFGDSGACLYREQAADLANEARDAYYGTGTLPAGDMVAPDAPFLPADDHV